MMTGIVELSSDHPGFGDPEYRRRRDEIAAMARSRRKGAPPPRVSYTETENATWHLVFEVLAELRPSHACLEYCQVLDEIGFSSDQIPQLQDVSRFLQDRTGFRLEPVMGLVSARDFLTALGQRVFCSTQYIRHHSRPHYTPEPDIVHELMGHAPMLAIEEFADLSQKIGERANRATDAQVEQLATLYWCTVEFGVVRQSGALRAYGAGLLSSFGELRRMEGAEVEIRPFDPDAAKDLPYPITTYQPVLWEVASIREAFEHMAAFVDSL